ncbi:MAG: hypothetical protein HY329_28360 [Chloroflexi bacterium]|nr:hypothetical protein [Chloroflexota bacterium]
MADLLGEDATLSSGGQAGREDDDRNAEDGVVETLDRLRQRSANDLDAEPARLGVGIEPGARRRDRGDDGNGDVTRWRSPAPRLLRDVGR